MFGTAVLDVAAVPAEASPTNTEGYTTVTTFVSFLPVFVSFSFDIAEAFVADADADADA